MDEKEQAFVKWWEENKEREKRWVTQLAIGLPLGFVFGLPVFLSLMFGG